MKSWKRTAVLFLLVLSLLLPMMPSASFADTAKSEITTVEKKEPATQSKNAPAETKPAAKESSSPKAVDKTAGEGIQPVLSLTVYFLNNKGVSVAQPLMYRFQKGWNEKTEVKAPSIEGYTPDKATLSIDFSRFTEKENSIIVRYEPNLVTYYVQYKLEDLDGNYQVEKTVERKGYVGDETEVPVESFEGFQVKSVPEAQTIPVKDKSLTVSVEYARKFYQLSFATNGGAPVSSRTMYFGAPIANLEEATKTGMKFEGWYMDEALQVPFEDKTPMPSKDLVLYAKWSPADTSYNINVMVQDPNHPEKYELFTTVRRAGVTGQPTEIPTDTMGLQFPGLIQRDMAHFSLFYTMDEEKTKESQQKNPTIAADGSTTLSVYYNRKEYTLVFVPFYSSDNSHTRVPFDPDAMGWAPIITYQGQEYTKPYLRIKVRFGQDILGIFPSRDAVKLSQATRDKWPWPVEFTDYYLLWERRDSNGKPLNMEHASFNQGVVDILYGYCLVNNEKDIRYVGVGLQPTQFIVKGKMHTYLMDLKGDYPSTPNFPDQEYTFGSNYTGVRSQLNPEGFHEDRAKMEVIDPNRPNDYYFRVIKLPDGSLYSNVYLARNKSSLVLYTDGTAATKQKPIDVFFDYPLYASGDLPAVLVDPTDAERPAGVPEDFTFGGWYLDPEFKVPMPHDMKMPNHTLSLFGKWVPKNSVLTVTFDLGIAGAASDKWTVKVPYGTQVAAPKTPERAGYRFLGWRVVTDTRSLPEVYDFSAYVTKDLILQAMWEENRIADLTVRYVKDDSGEVFKSETIKDLAVHSKYTAKAVAIDGYLPDERLKTVDVQSDPSKNVITFHYAPFTSTSYRILCLVQDENGQVTVLKTEGPVVTKLNSDAKVAPEIPGFVPVGQIQQTLPFVQDPQENTFRFFYRSEKEGSYSVETYYSDGKGNYVRDDAKTAFYSVPVGTKVSVSPAEKEGHYVLNTQKSVLAGVVSANEQTVLKVYYDLKTPSPAPTTGSTTEPKKPETKPAENKNTSKAPKTGDSALVAYGSLLLLGSSILAATALPKRRRTR